MVAVGLSKYQVLPGEWLGPGSASYIIRDLCERHYHIWKLLCKQNEEYENVVHRPNDARNPDSHKPPPRVYVVQEGCIYRPMVEKLMTNDSTSTSYNHSRAFETKDNPDAPISIQERNDDEHSKYHPLERKKTKAMYDPLTPMLDSGTNHLDINAPWDTSLLLLIPLRLGLKSFNVDYSISLASTFQLPQSVGFVGGSPRHALWFYGALSNGSKLYGLDPHTVQHAPSCFFPSPQATGYDPMVCHIDLTDEYLRTVQFPAASSALDFSKIDPSLALGFLCRDRVDFSAFCDAISRINASSKSPELFTISDLNSPCYGMDVDSMADDPLSSILDNEDRRKSSDIPVEDDEYVLL
jgi:cysteine protease ATG4